ncbi:hypothetical protein MNV49_007837 [Pseudohyphozyma bogoriensis]|nr:hypothetical protein MNV49_007837 [Pseudohyphozyma bogoriensis]
MSGLAGPVTPSPLQSSVPSLPAPPPNTTLSTRSSLASSPSPTNSIRTFDADALRPYIRRAFGRLQNAVWSRDGERSKAWCREIGEEVKAKMMELEPRGYKYLVSCSIIERGAGGHAHLTAFWDETADCSVSEVFTNDSISCSVLAVAMRYNLYIDNWLTHPITTFFFDAYAPLALHLSSTSRLNRTHAILLLATSSSSEELYFTSAKLVTIREMRTLADCLAVEEVIEGVEGMKEEAWMMARDEVWVVAVWKGGMEGGLVSKWKVGKSGKEFDVSRNVSWEEGLCHGLGGCMVEKYLLTHVDVIPPARAHRILDSLVHPDSSNTESDHEACVRGMVDKDAEEGGGLVEKVYWGVIVVKQEGEYLHGAVSFLAAPRWDVEEDKKDDEWRREVFALLNGDFGTPEVSEYDSTLLEVATRSPPWPVEACFSCFERVPKHKANYCQMKDWKGTHRLKCGELANARAAATAPAAARSVGGSGRVK